MAQASRADYLVTGDHAGLLEIGHIGRTQIVTAATFVSVIT
jgi:predicted nucleic acid-binding protein